MGFLMHVLQTVRIYGGFWIGLIKHAVVFIGVAQSRNSIFASIPIRWAFVDMRLLRTKKTLVLP